MAKVFNNNVNALKHEEKNNISKSPSFTSVELIVEKEDLDNSPKKKQEPWLIFPIIIEKNILSYLYIFSKHQ